LPSLYFGIVRSLHLSAGSRFAPSGSVNVDQFAGNGLFDFGKVKTRKYANDKSSSVSR